MVYHANKPWEKEDDDFITGDSSSPHERYSGDKEYGANPAKDYHRMDEQEGKKDDEKTIEDDVKKETAKYKSKDEDPEDKLKVKAAQDILRESKSDSKEAKKTKSKEHKTIEDAINKAIEEEKELIYMEK